MKLEVMKLEVMKLEVRNHEVRHSNFQGFHTMLIHFQVKMK